ncbi:MAG: threonine--tRNA ligase [Candidatus Woesearchaeota archaeon]|nr:threonine--tRNA ligase [Candidatus Woesearchaeota archaeon]MDP7181366.1 threonine--tRNA ligase [Candidatus Woesearchaeota archaeon]MDP7198016.1 threonine--tRNA ligase [Candidatus Woesearchaeota archaeon]MDP7466850.1 threonine--tRNA ligase [Candidatus Woesearchaeota archaeon]MDP7647286.1 threonine--tRNA ligase [Candidatus Woesearchaeota archaeon]
MVKLTLPDGSVKDYPKGTTVQQVADKLGLRDVLAGVVDGNAVDTFYELSKDATFKLVRWGDKEGKEVYWHSAAHVLAYAVQQIFPKAKNTIGPAIENGFYYDFDFGDYKLTEKDLERIEVKMKEIAGKSLSYTKSTIPKESVKKLFPDNPYKTEIADEHEEAGLTIYKMGDDFTDLCRGPHVPSTSVLKSFKLLNIAGAYWKGDAEKQQLTRIYGIAFPKEKLLKEYLEMIEKAKQNDHRKLAKEMGLLVFSEMVGPGLPLYTPHGTILRNEIVQFSRELNTSIGFEEVHTPNITKAELFKTSGHYDKFKADMLSVKSNYSKEEYFLKPMNCPHHTQIYASQFRTYKDLPIRISDFANLYRDEKPGELQGLTRLRCFSQDDGHAFCTKDQIKQEFKNVLGVVQKALEVYKMEYKVRLSFWDPKAKEKYLGDESVWEESQALLKDLLDECKIDYETEDGEAAFYGPKMDVIAVDALGREWQISTIQLDFNMPGRFGLKYVDEKGEEQTPIMIHRALIGSPERFLGILLEHFAGRLPTWLAPQQVKVLPISDKFNDYAKHVADSLPGVRASIDDRNERLQKKILEAETSKVKYILIVGEKEKTDESVSVRLRDGKSESQALHIFAKAINEEIKNRA